MATTKEERLLKSAKAGIRQAAEMLVDTDVSNIEIQTLRNAATQAMQSAMELTQLLGMLDADRRDNAKPFYAFINAERFDVPGRGTVFSVKCPFVLPGSLKKLMNNVIEINNEPWRLINIEHQGEIQIDSNIGLVVRALTADELVSYKVVKQLKE
jgi:hypothetical protein